MHPALADHSRGEAVRSLAKYLGTTETRAAHLLADPDEYAVEIRARNAPTVDDAFLELEARREPPMVV